jgi:hypothetical protein
MYQPKDSTGISKSLFTFFAIVIVVWNIIDFDMGKGILIDKKKIVLLEPQDNDVKFYYWYVSMLIFSQFS